METLELATEVRTTVERIGTADLVVGLADDGSVTGPVALLDASAVLGLARTRASRPR